ncbi:MAG TPA: hypothetical protein VFM61_02695 [Pseudidiomarina sp.]|nr:hypothetical protein [Pseudidiomarina sp.]
MSLQSTAILVVGVGTIGQAWLRRYAHTIPMNLQASVRGLYRSNRYAVLAETAEFDRVEWQSTRTVLARIHNDIRSLKSQHQHVVVLDLTATDEVGRRYVDWFKSGAHIVSANKYAGASALSEYIHLRQVVRQYQRYWRYNTTVGAGLPIQSAIRERLDSADPIIEIEGNFSGSLSWIFQHYRPQEGPQNQLSDWLLAAAENGLTEPDPRSDLNGLDVARKLLILAREAGWSLDLSDIQVQSLVPPALTGGSADTFWQRLPEFDVTFEQWRLKHDPQAQQFCYIGRVSLDAQGLPQASATLQAIDPYSPYANLPPGNANFSIRSHLYDTNPLLIQGPGAGPEVTAAGIHTDLLDILHRL